MVAEKYAYMFEEGDGKNKYLIGGKGANLCEMTQIGLPVPPGFVITTSSCVKFYENNEELPEGLMDEVKMAMMNLEEKTGKKFGGEEKPLLVSVRSGAAVSMPGMMDTILNLGLNDKTVEALEKMTNDPRFAWDSYRRFVSLFGSIALGIGDEPFHRAMEEMKRKKNARYDTDLSAEDLKELTTIFKSIIKEHTGKEFPQDPYLQLEEAIKAVFRSWNGKRCVDYRREFKITPDMANGTAVNIQTMVFGNFGPRSGTGVGFTRDPATGENKLFGDFLMMAQGEDIVAGIRTPRPIVELKSVLPKVYNHLLEVRSILERHFREVQDFEFTIEDGKLYILQTRNAKMNALALVKTSVDMVHEGLITKEEAIMRIPPKQLIHLMYKHIDPKVDIEPTAVGVAASPGSATGEVVFSADDAERKGRGGRKVILVREQTKPEDIHGFFASQGILTSIGGKTSHAAVVARSMGKPCVSGCADIKIFENEKYMLIGEHRVVEGEIITIDGSTGRVWLGEIPTVEPEISHEFNTLLEWADEIRSLGIYANADTPEDALRALRFGAEGIGLCRTERMFNAVDRLPIFQEMILAETEVERRKYLNKLLPMQLEDFKKILKAMEGKTVTIRLLDPPLHEFLPATEEVNREIDMIKKFQEVLETLSDLPNVIRVLDPSLHTFLPPTERMVKDLSKIRAFGMDKKVLQKKLELLRKIKAMTEVNPMLGHRGVRLGITYPEIYEMQVEAILTAAAELINEGIEVHPEIMVPQVCTAQELRWVYKIIEKVEKKIYAKYKVKVKYKFGTMIEVVRACMRAGRLAEIAEFFSFGTNDLTQATFSFSREDAENKFLPLYNERGILQDNPFEILDRKGMGRLMMITIEWGRKTRPDLIVGICGEHGGEPTSIEFCHGLGLNYVSCSPYRVPIARLAAAQAKIKEKRGELKLF